VNHFDVLNACRSINSDSVSKGTVTHKRVFDRGADNMNFLADSIVSTSILIKTFTNKPAERCNF